MGFFKTLKSTFGVSNIKLNIDLNTYEFNQEDTIKGKLLMLSEESKDVTVKAVIVKLVQFEKTRYLDRSTNEYKTKTVSANINKVVSENEFVIKPKQDQICDFEIKIPRCTATSVDYKYKLNVSLDVKGFDPKKNVDIYIL